jgi:hypothetical protein
MATYFQNPANGYTEKATGGWTWLWAFLFGPIYLIYKGAWPHALVYLLVAIFLNSPSAAGAAFILIEIAYAAAIYPIVRTTYRRAGWIETSDPARRHPPTAHQLSPAVWRTDERSL